MSYRGEDLDLRTQMAPSVGRDPAEAESAAKAPLRGPARGRPLWVDDTVLASANHAFDIAHAHRAAEVRLEHFLHALTRIDAAADALEARGVRVAAMRRESATIIASEIPVAAGGGKTPPRGSDEFADVLLLASHAAARRNGPATVEDVLNVLFDLRNEMPGLGLLVRHTLRTGIRDTFEQFPPLSRYPGEMRYVAAPVERYSRSTHAEPVWTAPEPVRTYRDDTASGTDAAQNARIAALEQIVRALSDDLAKERQVVSGMLKELSADVRAHRTDQGEMHTGLYDRIGNLERLASEHRGAANADGIAEQLLNLEVMLEQRLKDFGEGWSAAAARIDALDTAMRQSSGGQAAGEALQRIASRLDMVEETLAQRLAVRGGEVGERLSALEAAVEKAVAAGSGNGGKVEALISDLALRTGGAHEAHQSAINGAVEVFGERLAAVEQALAAEIETAAAKHNVYVQDLGEVHEALMKLNQNQHTLAGSMDQWRTDAAGDVAMLANRIGALDRDALRPAETLNRLAGDMDKLNRFLVDRYRRRHRFLYWLYGTDDWLGASWPRQAAAADAERAKNSADGASE